ncbi:FUSC family protein [Isoptericola sp. b490]|uniref:FUSC family protein n=1 Tax=Actinotalea lenta TaxID=3064654 RepID=UPI0027131CD1|nr:FUSC family protein [Isoptericola sp. b490]MDO8121845.1 FUSC family protein [Isoptericola sp. b490]
MRFGPELAARARQGWARVRRAAVPVALASVGAGGAYAIARYGLGHPKPFFAPVAAWIALGFSADRNLRRVAELAIGVAIGVLAGDQLVHRIGTGAIQVAVVLALAVLLARLLDRGDLLAVQAGVQAMIVVVLPASGAGGPVGRWLDAAVGGLVALVIAALTPQDPRRRARSVAEEAMTEIAEVLGALAQGLRTGDPALARQALLRGRASQPVLDAWHAAAVSARQAARLSPAFRRHRDELAALVAAATLADRAMRNARVLARRAESVAGDEDVAALAEVVELARRGAQETAAALSTGAGTGAAVRTLARAAEQSDPWHLAPGGDLHVQGLVLLLRSLVVDLAETAGVEPEAARAMLPEI